jgi:hypothetical protein
MTRPENAPGMASDFLPREAACWVVQLAGVLLLWAGGVALGAGLDVLAVVLALPGAVLLGIVASCWEQRGKGLALRAERQAGLDPANRSPEDEGLGTISLHYRAHEDGKGGLP